MARCGVRNVSASLMGSPLASALATADAVVGDGITRQVVRHHRRRLERLGWSSALDPPAGGWAVGLPPARSGNALEVLIDGARALPLIASELESAASHVHIAGWYFSPRFALVRGDEEVILRDLLARVAQRVEVRVLVWAGAPLPLFRPSRRRVRAMQADLTEGTRIVCRLDDKERPLHCHHEKTIVIDDRVAFVGGIDLTSESGDRFDSSQHPLRAGIGWHDCCARIEGPAVADVADHFRLRWKEVAGETLPAPATCDPAGDVDVQVVRTVPERVYKLAPTGDFRILESYLRALRSAEQFVYLENQFLWSPEIEAVLADKLSNPPRDDFRVLIVLPAKPNTGADDTRGVIAELITADANAGRLLACTLYSRNEERSMPVYVHAKIGIVDDRWLTVGSANLNEHSLFNDTEMNIVTHDPRVAKDVRLGLWSEHLELPVEALAGSPSEVIDTLWRRIGLDQRERRERGAPLTHRLVELPGVSRRASRLLGPVKGLLVDG
jgi:phosphatidylserine/phosphatidylglycerophosphate/cardiolipin synthase-like enzyme